VQVDYNDSRINTRVGPKLKIVIVVLMLGLIAFVAFRTSGPWLALRAKYPGPSPENLQFARGTIELRSANRAGVAIHKESVEATLGPTSVSLAMRAPMGIFLRPIAVPAQAVATCERRQMSERAIGIELWLSEAAVGIGFPLLDETTVLNWCREHGIRLIGDAATAK
jgi:hypothetical protein